MPIQVKIYGRYISVSYTHLTASSTPIDTGIAMLPAVFGFEDVLLEPEAEDEEEEASEDEASDEDEDEVSDDEPDGCEGTVGSSITGSSLTSSRPVSYTHLSL